MAFPTSPSNNQVHKEGNRAFVYDSTLDVWDQVRETDRTENNLLSGELSGAVTGTLGSGVTFPAGHTVLIDHATVAASGTSVSGQTSWTSTNMVSITVSAANIAKYSKILVQAVGNYWSTPATHNYPEWRIAETTDTVYGQAIQTGHQGTTPGEITPVVTLVYYEDISAQTDEHIFVVQWREGNGTNAYVGTVVPNLRGWYMTIWGIV